MKIFNMLHINRFMFTIVADLEIFDSLTHPNVCSSGRGHFVRAREHTRLKLRQFNKQIMK